MDATEKQHRNYDTGFNYVSIFISIILAEIHQLQPRYFKAILVCPENRNRPFFQEFLNQALNSRGVMMTNYFVHYVFFVNSYFYFLYCGFIDTHVHTCICTCIIHSKNISHEI